MAEFCDNGVEEPVCDFCAHYFFSREGRTYYGNGYCCHPDHPHGGDPEGGCNDYKCQTIDGRADIVDRMSDKVVEAIEEAGVKNARFTEERLDELYEEARDDKPE